MTATQDDENMHKLEQVLEALHQAQKAVERTGKQILEASMAVAEFSRKIRETPEGGDNESA